MAEFERLHRYEASDRDAFQPEREPEGSGQDRFNHGVEEPGNGTEDGAAPLPADWNGHTREVLQGLTEEVLDNAEGKPPSSDPAPQLDPSVTTRRMIPHRQRRPARERPMRPAFTLEQRMLILDAWVRSGLPGTEFAPLVGVAPHTLYCWRRAFEAEGPAGLVHKPRGAPAGSRLPEVTKRAILLMKQDHPDWGCGRISDVLMRGPALGASAAAVANVLHEAGYESEDVPTRPHPPHVHRFERARPNYVTWRGKSAFSRELDKLGIRQVVAARQHPQTLGKIERFWGTLWRECLEGAIFQDLGDARRRIGLFLDYYNFQRTHSAIDGLVPADRFFGAASEVLRTLRTRVAANALEIELVPLRAAQEAAVVVLREMDRKRATPWVGTMTDRTVAVDLVPLRGRRDEPQQVQHLLHGHARSHCLKIDARHRIGPEMRRGNPYSFYHA